MSPMIIIKAIAMHIDSGNIRPPINSDSGSNLYAALRLCINTIKIATKAGKDATIKAKQMEPNTRLITP